MQLKLGHCHTVNYVLNQCYCLCLCLWWCVSVCDGVSVSVMVSVCVCDGVSVSVMTYVCLSASVMTYVCLSVSDDLCLSVCRCLWWCLSVSVMVCVCLRLCRSLWHCVVGCIPRLKCRRVCFMFTGILSLHTLLLSQLASSQLTEALWQLTMHRSVGLGALMLGPGSAPDPTLVWSI